MTSQAITLLVLSLLSQSHANPEGAPAASCDDMMPRHVGDPETTTPPYGLTATANEDGSYHGNISDLFNQIK